MPYKKKITIIIAVCASLIALYYIFKLDIYNWSCQNESIPSSCYIVGMIYKERGQNGYATSFFKQSCELNYALGCGAYSDQLLLNGDQQNGAIFKKKACDLKLERACR